MESRSLPAPAADAAGASPAEELPGLYRVILERVEALEQLGDRAEAIRIRRAATEIYSSSWDAVGRKRLMGLITQAERQIDGQPRPRAWALRRRSAPAR